MLLTSVAAFALPAQAANGWVVDRTMTDKRITEASGLAPSRYNASIYWTHNDSGHDATIYALNANGSTAASYLLTGAASKDWEAIASTMIGSTSYLYIGDIGDNGVRRKKIVVYRVAEPRTLSGGTLTPVTYTLNYPDGPHNAEGILVHPSTHRLYVVTKDNGTAGAIYAAPATLSTSGTNMLTKVATTPRVVTDATFMNDGRLVLRRYSWGYLASSVGGTYKRFDLPEQPQGESVAPAADGDSVLIGTEGRYTPVWQVPLP